MKAGTVFAAPRARGSGNEKHRDRISGMSRIERQHRSHDHEDSENACARQDQDHGIVVFAPWPANPYGHVAFVEKVDERGRFTISHANFAVGELWQKRDGIPIYRAEFEQVPGGARVLGGRHVFALRGYLSPSTEHRAITAAQRPGEHPG